MVACNNNNDNGEYQNQEKNSMDYNNNNNSISKDDDDDDDDNNNNNNCDDDDSSSSCGANSLAVGDDGSTGAAMDAALSDDDDDISTVNTAGEDGDVDGRRDSVLADLFSESDARNLFIGDDEDEEVEPIQFDSKKTPIKISMQRRSNNNSNNNNTNHNAHSNSSSSSNNSKHHYPKNNDEFGGGNISFLHRPDSSGGSEGRSMNDFSTVSDQADVGQSLTAFLPKTVLAEILRVGEDDTTNNNTHHNHHNISSQSYINTNNNDDACSKTSTDTHGSSTISGVRPIYRRTASSGEIKSSAGGSSSSNNNASALFTNFQLGPRMWPEATGGMLMADVSGFTKFMAALSKSFNSRKGQMMMDNAAAGSSSMGYKGSSGSHRTRHHDPSEQMSLILNNYFGAMVQTVEKHGGDVIKFAGDALICYWPIANSSADSNRKLSRGGIAHYCVDERDMRDRMAQCALELVRDLNEYDTGHPNPDDGSPITLSLHIACMVMKIKGLHIGGLNGRLEFLLAGPGFGKLGILLDTAKNGEISIGKDMWDAFQTESQQSQLNNGSTSTSTNKVYSNISNTLANSEAKAIWNEENNEIAGYRIIEAHALLRRRQQQQQQQQGNNNNSSSGHHSVSETGLEIQTELATYCGKTTRFDPSVYEAASSDPCIRAYVPSNVLHYHDHSQANLLSENRTVTVVFCSLPAGTCATFESAQNALLKIQKVLQRYNGLLRQFIEDDKATVVIGVWGCPPLSHQDDPMKAIDAALALRDKLGPCNIGVATGSCYCGAVGTPERCEYVVIGNAVNLSARMMGLGIKKMAQQRQEEQILAMDANNNNDSDPNLNHTTKEGGGDNDDNATTTTTTGATTTKQRNNHLGTVICDETTRAAIFAYEERFAVIDQGEKEFKGVGKQCWNEIEHLDSGQVIQTMPICGREEEQALLNNAFYASMACKKDEEHDNDDEDGDEEKPKTKTSSSSPKPFIMAVHGPLGIGKSFLTSHFRRNVRDSEYDVEVVDCQCSEQEKNTPWFALQGLLPILWRNVKTLAENEMKTIAFLEDISPDLTPSKYAEKVQLSRKVFVDNLVGETRLANILDLLFLLLSKQLERHRDKPLLIMVDDLQNCDMNSLQFFDKFVDICKEQPSSALLYIAVRPGAPKEVKDLLNKLDKVIKLKRLSSDAIQKLVKTELGVPLDSRCHVNFEDAVEKGSGGLPLFVSELCRFIRHRKLFVTDEEHGLCLTEEGETTFSKASSSSPEEATQNAVRSIIDGLSPEGRLLLKCSSLLPNQFRLSDVNMLSKTMIHTSYSSSEEASDVDAQQHARSKKTKDAIDEIIANRLWERCNESGAGSKKFRFSHGYMSETVYYSMTLAQRESLHQTYFALLETEEAKKKKDNDQQQQQQQQQSRKNNSKGMASASYEWIASNAALASIHDKAALYYFKSAQQQHRSFAYVAANASLENAFDHLEVHDGEKEGLEGSDDTNKKDTTNNNDDNNNNNSNNPAIDLTTRIQMTRLRGFMYCLLDRPLEGKPLLEKTLEIAREDGIFLPPTLLADGISIETERQHVHRQLKLTIGSANVFAVYENETDHNNRINNNMNMKTTTNSNNNGSSKHNNSNNSNNNNNSNIKQQQQQQKEEDTRKLILRECCAVYDQLARSYFQSGEPFRAIYCCLRGLNLAEMVGHCEELAKAYATYAFVKKSAFYGSLARKSAERVGSLAPVTGFCAMLYGGMLIGEGHFSKSQTALKQAANVSKEVKDVGTLGLSLSVLGWSMFVNGQFEDAYSTATEMETIGKERNDPRFLNWGLTSHFRNLLAMNKTDQVQGLLPAFEAYMEEYWGSMYNSDKVASVGMLIKMHLANDDLTAVTELVQKYQSTVELVMKPCTQLIEFGGCVGVIEGLIAVVGAEQQQQKTDDTNDDSKESNSSAAAADQPKTKREILQTALDSFDKYAETYPILHARANYLRGLAILAMADYSNNSTTTTEQQQQQEETEKSAIASFREAISWARRFSLDHEEDLVTFHELANAIYALPIETKVFDRQDAGTKGIDAEAVIKKYKTLLEDLNYNISSSDETNNNNNTVVDVVEEEMEKWRTIVSCTCQNLLQIWGSSNPNINTAARSLEQRICSSTPTTLLLPDNNNNDDNNGNITNSMSKDELTILSLCIAKCEKMRKEAIIADS